MRLASFVLFLIIPSLSAVLVTFEVDMRATDLPAHGYPWAVTINHSPGWEGWGVTLSDPEGDGVMHGSKNFSPNELLSYQVAASGASDAWSGWGQVVTAPAECSGSGAYNVSVGSADITVRICAGYCEEVCPGFMVPLQFNTSELNTSTLACSRWHSWSASRYLHNFSLEDYCDGAFEAWQACTSTSGGANKTMARSIGSWRPTLAQLPIVRPWNTSEGMVVQSSKRPHPVHPQHYRIPGPYPTNVWWATLGIADGTGTFTSLPYTHQSSTSGMRVCAPQLKVEAKAATLSCATTVSLTLGMHGLEAIHEIVAFDDLSVTVEYTNESVSNSKARMTLMHGDPYVSVLFSGDAQPKVLIDGSPLIGVDDELVGGSSHIKKHASVTAHTLLRFANGERWALFFANETAKNLTWTQTEVVFDAPFEGWLRAAAVPRQDEGSKVDGLPLCILDKYSSIVTTGGNVNAYRATENKEDLHVQFIWTSQSIHIDTDLADGQAAIPLLLTLPHHRERMVHDTPPSASTWFVTHRGRLSPMAAANWTLKYSLSLTPVANTTTFNRTLDSPWSFEVPFASCSMKEEAFWALHDVSTFDPGVWPGSVYWGGKGWWKLARLVLLAAEMEDTELEEQLHARLRQRLTEALSPTGPLSSTHLFVHEPEWGGVMHNATMDDFMTDFGAGWYNDHHFHYGYVWYAAAVVARRDAAWAEQWGPYVRLLVRDVASPVTDGWFPSFRSMDWWLGHSSAGGVFPGEKNQESTSEAAGAYYACYLWGIASADEHVRDLCFALQAVETASDRRYWQMTVNDSTIAAPFADRKVVGIMWGHKAVYDTWFSQAAEHIHLIQFLPFSPASVPLLPASWVAEQWPALQAEMGANADWPDLQISNLAIMEPEKAWQSAMSLSADQFGSGTTRADTLWWIGTRPGLPDVQAGKSCNRTMEKWSCPVDACCPSEFRVISKGGSGGYSASGFWRGRERLAVPVDRGLTVVVISAASMRVVASSTFDTYSSSAHSAALVMFLAANASNTGDIVLISAVDDASTQLADAVAAIQALGSQRVTSLGFRDSFAAILVRGFGAVDEASAEWTEPAASARVQFLCSNEWYVVEDPPSPPAVPAPSPPPSYPFDVCVAVEISWNKVSYASSFDLIHPASHVNDGDHTTRWASATTAINEWVAIDLGGVYVLDRVELLWEDAYAFVYVIEVATDSAGYTWRTAASVSNGKVGSQTVSAIAGVQARHVRMRGRVRGTNYGYSLYEFRIYGYMGGACSPLAPMPPVAPHPPWPPCPPFSPPSPSPPSQPPLPSEPPKSPPLPSAPPFPPSPPCPLSPPCSPPPSPARPPSPPEAPPSPHAPPSPPMPLNPMPYRTTIELVVSGYVEDYSIERRSAISNAVAHMISIDPIYVNVKIIPASVILVINIVSDTYETNMEVVAVLSRELRDAAVTSELLMVPAETTPMITSAGPGLDLDSGTEDQPLLQYAMIFVASAASAAFIYVLRSPVTKTCKALCGLTLATYRVVSPKQSVKV